MINMEFTTLQALTTYIEMFSNFKYFPILALAALVFVIAVALNLKSNNSRILFLGLNIILAIIICFTHGINIINNIDTFFETNILKNVYFYLANMVICLIIISSSLKSKRIELSCKYLICVLYYFLLLNLIHMLYVSNYLKNIMLLVMPNTYPMVYFGNIVAFLIYALLILYWLFFMGKKKKHRLGNHL